MGFVLAYFDVYAICKTQTINLLAKHDSPSCSAGRAGDHFINLVHALDVFIFLDTKLSKIPLTC